MVLYITDIKACIPKNGWTISVSVDHHLLLSTFIRTGKRRDTSTRVLRIALFLQVRTVTGHVNAVHDIFNGLSFVRNLVDGLHEGKFIQHAATGQHVVHFLGGQGTLQLLSVEQVAFNLGPLLFAKGLGVGRNDAAFCGAAIAFVRRSNLLFVVLQSFFGKRLGASSVATTVAGGDEIGHAAALRERLILDLPKDAAKLGHLQETHPEEGGFGVAAEADTVYESGSQSNDILECPAHFSAGDVRHVVHAKAVRIKHLAGVFVRRGAKVARQGAFAVLTQGDFVGHVGSHEHSALEIRAHLVRNLFGDENGGLGGAVKVCAYVSMEEAVQAQGKTTRDAKRRVSVTVI